MQAADQLDDDVDIGVENCTKVFGPDYVAWNPRLFLAFDIAIADMGEAELSIAIFALAENFSHGAAHVPETYEGNSARGETISGRGG